MHKRIRNHAGFSLLELLVVVGIMMTITGAVIVNASSGQKREKIRQIAKTLRSDLESARTKAVSGVKPRDALADPCTVLLGYSVTFSEQSYTYRALCDSGVVQEERTVTLPREVVFSPVPLPLFFEVLKGSVSQEFSITLSSFELLYRIDLNATGYIEDVGFIDV